METYFYRLLKFNWNSQLFNTTSA